MPPTTTTLTVYGSFLASAVAACSACVFTNPAEVVKTRLQLDGERRLTNSSSSTSSSRIYRGVFHALVSIWNAEGIQGLQAGLQPALFYQITMNGSRLGLYEPAQRFLKTNFNIDTDKSWAKGLSGAMSGAVGASLGSPFFLVKSRMQAQSIHFKAAEIHQYSNMYDGFSQIIKAEGFRGLLRGVDGALPRVMCGSAAQLSSYDVFKSYLQEQDKDTTGHYYYIPSGVSQHIVASVAASLITVTVMNPLDVISTRLYQSAGKNTSYTSPIDCLIKTIKTEGIFALQKGWLAQFARLGPHTVLTFVFLEQIKPIMSETLPYPFTSLKS
jgi:solute carrier family 25, member 34/35